MDFLIKLIIFGLVLLCEYFHRITPKPTIKEVVTDD